MADFNYQGIQSNGNKTNGTLSANSRKDALLKLQAKGIKPLSVKESSPVSSPIKQKAESKDKSKKGTPSLSFSFKRKTKKHGPLLGMEFYRQLMELHDSGLPIADAIRILSKRTSSTDLKELYGEIWEKLSSGHSFASALSFYPQTFDQSLVKVIEAASATGNIAPILRKIIQYLEEQQEIKKKILSSISYPIFICFVAFGVILFFVFVLLPQVRSMLDSLGGEMTLSAKILINGTDFAVMIFPYAVGVILLSASSIMAWMKSAKGKDIIDTWILKVPVIGSILYYRSMYQTIHLITTLLENKIDTTDCLRMAEKTLSNNQLREKMSNARQMVVEGVSFSNAFDRNKILPPLNIDILRVGEETGSLINALGKIGDGFKIKLADRLHFATTTVSTGALIFAFGLVAMIAFGIVSSILQLSNNILVK